MRKRLVDIRSSNYRLKGITSQDILTGFPADSVEEIIQICHKDISAEELYKGTSILNKDILDVIIDEIKDVYNDFNHDSEIDDLKYFYYEGNLQTHKFYK